MLLMNLLWLKAVKTPEIFLRPTLPQLKTKVLKFPNYIITHTEMYTVCTPILCSQIVINFT